MGRLLTTGAEEPELSAVWDDMNDAGSIKGDLMVALGRTKNRTFLPRTGRGMLCLPSSGSYVRNWTPANPTELWFGFAMRHNVMNNAGQFFIAYTEAAQGTSNSLNLRTTTSGAIQLYRTGTIVNTTAVCLTVDTWQYIEVYLKPRNSSGNITVKVEGTEVANWTGDTTDSQEYINGYALYGTGNGNGVLPSTYDDIVVNDASGSVNNSWPGMVRLMPFRGMAAGNYAQWTRGGVNLGSDLAQVIGGTHDFSMLQTSSADQKVTFDAETPDLPGGITIKNIVVSGLCRVQNGSGVIAPMVRANGNDSISADQTLTSNWRHKQYAWAKNPEDNGDWEEADLANLEIGVSS